MELLDNWGKETIYLGRTYEKAVYYLYNCLCIHNKSRRTILGGLL